MSCEKDDYSIDLPSGSYIANQTIAMTGHPNANSNVGDNDPKNQAQKIIDFCEKNGQFCLDYYGTYWQE